MPDFATSTFTSPSTNRELFYYTAGPKDGPLMILLHGWPGIALTWKYQLESFGSLGFYVVAPDMPGYGKSWKSSNSSDFALEKLVPELVELLHHIGRKKAIWFGHDWGCGPLWSIASHHPEICDAIIAMSVPYRTLELGVQHLITTVDRDLYPESQYPNGQWDYQIMYELDPRAGDRQFESDIPKFTKLIYSKGSEESARAVARTANVVKNKGWFGGPNGNAPDLPLDMTVLDDDLYEKLTESLTRSGFVGATAWYLNHAANEQYSRKSVNNGVLKMPVLFIHTEYDAVCQTVYNPRLTADQRSHCENLQEFVIKAGHWGALERHVETNAGVVEWISRFVRGSYPGPPLKAQI